MFCPGCWLTQLPTVMMLHVFRYPNQQQWVGGVPAQFNQPQQQVCGLSVLSSLPSIYTWNQSLIPRVQDGQASGNNSRPLLPPTSSRVGTMVLGHLKEGSHNNSSPLLTSLVPPPSNLWHQPRPLLLTNNRYIKSSLIPRLSLCANEKLLFRTASGRKRVMSNFSHQKLSI